LFVVPTSRMIAPLNAMTSGMRKEPPISTSSPLDTMTSLPLARLASTSMTAAALLFTTSASSAPKQALVMGRIWSWREPLFPSGRSYSRSV